MFSAIRLTRFAARLQRHCALAVVQVKKVKAASVLPGQIMPVDGGMLGAVVSIHARAFFIITYSRRLLTVYHTSPLPPVPDMVVLENLHEASILECVDRRFKSNLIYVRRQFDFLYPMSPL